MPIEIKILKSTPAKLRASKNWSLRNPDFHYEFDHTAYYYKNAERRKKQAIHYRFVKLEFEKFRKILL